MKQLLSVLLCLALLLCLSSCNKETKQTESFYFMDTVITVTLYTSNRSLAKEQFAACRELLTELDSLWSRHAENGDIAACNASGSGCSGLDPRTVDLLKTAQEISANTNGCFDITLAELSDLWQTCGEENRLPLTEELTERLSKTGSDRFTVGADSVTKPEGMQFDLGAIGKGAAISMLVSLLESSGIPGGLVSFGSNVAVFGSKPDSAPFRIAIRDPQNPSGTVGTVTLSPGSVLSVSGSYERFVTIDNIPYHHILNPAGGMPADTGLTSVAVICSDGALADALSTALFVMGVDAAMEFHASGIYEFDAILITDQNEIITTGEAGFRKAVPTPG